MREVNGIELNRGDGMARGLYNLYNFNTDEVTLWFDKDQADKLKTASKEEFINFFNQNKH